MVPTVLNFDVNEHIKNVAIPSKSGQWFRREILNENKINNLLSQSLLNQVNGSDKENKK